MILKLLASREALKKVGGQVFASLLVLGAVGWFIINVIYPAYEKGMGARADITAEIMEAEGRSKDFAKGQSEAVMILPTIELNFGEHI